MSDSASNSARHLDPVRAPLAFRANAHGNVHDAHDPPSSLRSTAVAALHAVASRPASESGVSFFDQTPGRDEILEAVLRTLPIGIAVASAPSGAISFANAPFEAAVGRSITGARPIASIADYEQFEVWEGSGRRVEPHELPLSRALIHGETVEDVDLQLRRPDGSLVTLRTSASPIRGRDGRIVAAVVTVDDVTEIRRRERLLDGEARRKDELLAMLAHELRNPLAPILTAVEIMGREGDASIDGSPAFERQRAMIERQARHLARLVDGLVEVSRVTHGRIELQRERVRLDQLVERAVDAVRTIISERGHDLIVDLPPCEVDVDPVRIAQAVSNLVHNAAKYTAPGGEITIGAGSEGDLAWIEIRDSGIGISAQVLPHVFEPFVQAERTLARSEGGLGIGLTLVRRVVELHGGRVFARSEGPGRGSAFRIELPHTVAFASMAVPIGAGPCARTRPARRVLVVDDNVDAAEILSIALESSGHDVAVAHDGPSALEVAESFRPEVVLLDIGLPGIDGYEVARRLRADEMSSAVRLVALTGYGQPADRARAMQAGFDEHLVKPADLDQVEAAIGG
jgi:signal transduction histidine kinase